MLAYKTDSKPEIFDQVSAISELIAKQHWRKMREILKDSSPDKILQQLIDSEADPRLIVQYFRWLERDFGVLHSLDMHCRMLHLLFVGRVYSQVRKLLNGLVQNEKYSILEIFHKLSVSGDSFWVNSVLFDMLVQAYVRNSKLSMAVEALRRAWDYGFKLSVLSCNPVLSALAEAGDVKGMGCVFKEVIRRRIQPDLITFNIVISGLCKVGQLQKAGDLLEDIKMWGLSPSVVTYNALIDGYCKKGKMGKMRRADALMKEMMSMNICPNEITYNTLIDGFCRDQNLPAAMRIFKEMQDRGLKPGVITCNTLIKGFCADGKMGDALDVRNLMFLLGLKPDIVTYNVLINGYCKKGMLKEARELLDDADDKGLTPTVITFNTLIDGYCKI